MIERLKNVGPGALVTAAFIGPGTVTACTIAGASFGYVLLWAILFATVATVILQEMSARLGVVAQKGLGEALVEILQSSFWRWPMVILIGVALYLGNSAYEAGNLSGASLGIAAIAGDSEFVFNVSIAMISLAAAALLWAGRYKQIEAVLIVLVALMALAFVATFFIVRPDLAAIFSGMFSPSIPEGSLLTVVALIGTTVVPYNLFLHAAAAKRRWRTPDDLTAARSDTAMTIGLGGLIAILIISTAAASLFAAGLTVSSAGDMAVQLEPLFGSYSRILLGAGLLAAGLSSAITAPLATGYAMTEILPIPDEKKPLALRLLALSVIAVGAALSLTGIKPINIIISAQFANGLLLPIIAAFLLFAMNQKAVLGRYTNGAFSNVAGATVVVIATSLGLRLIMRAAESASWIGFTSPV